MARSKYRSKGEVEDPRLRKEIKRIEDENRRLKKEIKEGAERYLGQDSVLSMIKAQLGDFVE